MHKSKNDNKIKNDNCDFSPIVKYSDIPHHVKKRVKKRAEWLSLVNYLIDPAYYGASSYDLAKLTGLTQQAVVYWRNHQGLADFIGGQKRLIAGKFVPIGLVALGRRAAAGDIGALKFLMEYTGDYVPATQQDSRFQLNFMSYSDDELQRQILSGQTALQQASNSGQLAPVDNDRGHVSADHPPATEPPQPDQDVYILNNNTSTPATSSHFNFEESGTDLGLWDDLLEMERSRERRIKSFALESAVTKRKRGRPRRGKGKG